METLLQTGLLVSLINQGTDQNKNTDYSAAYRDFASQLHCLCIASADMAQLYFTLHYTRIELSVVPSGNQKKK